MSYNGSGTFVINSTGQPVVTGTVISSTAFNALTADLATGLSTAITKDGQTAATARIPFAQGISSTLVTDSTSTTTGSIITAGGVGIAKALFVGTTANFGGVATYSAQPIFSSLTASSAVATDASKGLVSVTNTGTGNNVLATSPTLVTPILGTPTSGSLVNCTDTNYTGFKNRIINGAMVISQSAAGAAVTVNGAYPVDRFAVGEDTTGAYSGQQDSSAPVGFVNSLKFTTTTADASIAAGETCFLRQFVEGNNVSDLAWGTASAKSVTLSFWVKSSLTGSFSGAIANDGYNRSYPFLYTIAVADTWEYKTVTIPGDTTGTWLTTTGIGLRIYWNLGTGTDNTGTAGAWVGAGNVGADSTVAVIGTLNATWFITGVQLEKGSTATSFDYRPYGTELALCQRYLPAVTSTNGSISAGYSYSTTQALYTVNFPVSARTQPTGITTSGSFSALRGDAASQAVSTVVFSNGGSSSSCEIVATIGSAAFTQGQGSQLRTSGAASILFTGCEL